MEKQIGYIGNGYMDIPVILDDLTDHSILNNLRKIVCEEKSMFHFKLKGGRR